MSKNAGSPGPDEPVGEHVRMRRAALARDRVDALHVLRAEVVEGLRDEADRLVLAHAGAQEAVELLVRGIHHRRRLGEQADLVAGLDAPGLHEHLLAVDDLDALAAAARTGSGSSMTSTPSGWSATPNFSSSRLILRASSSAMPASGVNAPRSVEMPARAPRSSRGRTGALVRRVRVGIHLGGRDVEPRVVQRVVLGGRAEVPRDRVGVAGEQAEADELVHRPRADVGRGHVPDVREVEREHAHRAPSARARP